MLPVALAVITLLLAAPVATASDLEDRGVPVRDDGVITRANLGPHEAWPLRIERGKFVCVGDAVFISDGETKSPQRRGSGAHPRGPERPTPARRHLAG